MFSPATRAGRRRAQTSRRLPSLATVSSISRPTVVKGLVGLGLASSVAAAIAIPVQASPGQVESSSQTSALVARDRAEAASGTTSRSAGRSAVSSARTALSAPAAAESAAVSAGTAGVTAVPKPKPAPKPKPKPAPVKKAAPKVEKKAATTSRARKSTTSRATTPTRSSASSSSGSGASMAYYDAGRAKGLGDNAAKVYSAIRSNFGITDIGGYRAGAGDHGAGKAVDVMVTGSRGDAVAQWAINNMGAYDITYVIWKQRIWLAGASGWRAMEDRGSVTANHYDHVHISVQ